jgi:hypothetical protein
METELADNKRLFRKRYAIRIPYKGAKGGQVSIPWMILQREASSRGLTVEEFAEQYEAECQFNNFPGVHYEFVLKELPKAEE